MKLAVLFSGGKDSILATWLAKKEGYEISCLISIESENKESFMFHTPSIRITQKQAELMDLPLIFQGTKGIKEIELNDLEFAINKAKEDFGIEGIITGAVESVYQASRVQKICNSLGLEVFNPLWQKSQEEIIFDLIKAGFEAIVVGVFAYPLDKTWIGRKINLDFLKEMKELNKRWGINLAGEGGEFESLVIQGPLFKEPLKFRSIEGVGEGNSWMGEVIL